MNHASPAAPALFSISAPLPPARLILALFLYHPPPFVLTLNPQEKVWSCQSHPFFYSAVEMLFSAPTDSFSLKLSVLFLVAPPRGSV